MVRIERKKRLSPDVRNARRKPVFLPLSFCLRDWRVILVPLCTFGTRH